jgi:hypothetical protein
MAGLDGDDAAVLDPDAVEDEVEEVEVFLDVYRPTGRPQYPAVCNGHGRLKHMRVGV